MNMNSILRFCFFIFIISSNAWADYRDDIGHTLLQTELGPALPNGSAVNVGQVEAASSSGAWVPDASDPELLAKTIIDQTLPASNGFSGHANGVAKLFYGDTQSIASGITSINSYSADDWLMSGFLNTGDSGSKPDFSGDRVTNHSWVGFSEDNTQQIDLADTSNALRRIDWLVNTDEATHVVAMNNGATNQPLLGSAYNVIAVGRTDGNHAQGSFALDADYSTGRPRPDVVAPVGVTSNATPIVAATAAVLIEQAHTAAAGPTTSNRSGDTVYNGERSEVVKAVIMAGADRQTHNTSTTAQINDYRADVANQTTNGLDKRFGAGQVNVHNSYHIMAGGEHDSQEDGGAALIGLLGYDYDEQFGGQANSNAAATYQFSTTAEVLELKAALVWNIDIAGGNGLNFDETATLYNLDLYLYDVTDGPGNDFLFASSESTLDNTENIWTQLLGGRDYQLQVQANGQFNSDYGLAWQLTSVPVPAAIWLFASALPLLGFGAKRRQFSTLK